MRARTWDLRVSWVALAGAALAMALAAAAYGQGEAPLVSQGKRLYTEQGCYGCHTMGKMGTTIATLAALSTHESVAFSPWRSSMYRAPSSRASEAA